MQSLNPLVSTVGAAASSVGLQYRSQFSSPRSPQRWQSNACFGESVGAVLVITAGTDVVIAAFGRSGTQRPPIAFGSTTQCLPLVHAGLHVAGSSVLGQSAGHFANVSVPVHFPSPQLVVSKFGPAVWISEVGTGLHWLVFVSK